MSDLKQDLSSNGLGAFQSKTSKMEALGMITAGLTHELRNPLAIASGFLSIIRSKEHFSQEVDNQLGEVSSAIKRISKIVAHVEKLVMQDETKSIPISVHDSLRSIMDIFENKMRKREVVLTYDFWEEDIFFLCRPTDFESIFINFLTNSCDAFENVSDGREKKITIKTRKIESERVCISYSDNAGGMDKKTLEQIFSPFFSTKKKTETSGMGIGLSIVSNIISSYSGEIQVESIDGSGTNFIIELPTIG